MDREELPLRGIILRRAYPLRRRLVDVDFVGGDFAAVPASPEPARSPDDPAPLALRRLRAARGGLHAARNAGLGGK